MLVDYLAPYGVAFTKPIHEALCRPCMESPFRGTHGEKPERDPALRLNFPHTSSHHSAFRFSKLQPHRPPHFLGSRPHKVTSHFMQELPRMFGKFVRGLPEWVLRAKQP